MESNILDVSKIEASRLWNLLKRTITYDQRIPVPGSVLALCRGQRRLLHHHHELPQRNARVSVSTLASKFTRSQL